MGNTNINVNRNKNSNFDFLSSYLSSILSQQRKGKAVASRAAAELPTTTASSVQLDTEAQEDAQQPDDDTQVPADESIQAPSSETEQQEEAFAAQNF